MCLIIGFEIKFAPLNWCGVLCIECFPNGEQTYLGFNK